jgi:hypothetical protein
MLTRPTFLTNIISVLATTSQERGLTPDQFKATFDEAPTSTKTYITDTLIPEIENVKIVPVPASKILALTDAYTLQECEHASVEIVNTIPNSTTVAFLPGTQIAFSRDGDAGVSWALASGVSISNTTKRKIANKGDSAVLVYKGNNVWKLYGSLKA